MLLIAFGVFSAVLGLGSFILGFEALHRRTGLSSARTGAVWVGHKHIHSNQGMLLALAVVIALLVVAFSSSDDVAQRVPSCPSNMLFFLFDTPR